jgi:hypothetical protein
MAHVVLQGSGVIPIVAPDARKHQDLRGAGCRGSFHRRGSDLSDLIEPALPRELVRSQTVRSLCRVWPKFPFFAPFELADCTLTQSRIAAHNCGALRVGPHFSFSSLAPTIARAKKPTHAPIVHPRMTPERNITHSVSLLFVYSRALHEPAAQKLGTDQRSVPSLRVRSRRRRPVRRGRRESQRTSSCHRI